jgi:hypothetical protein
MLSFCDLDHQLASSDPGTGGRAMRLLVLLTMLLAAAPIRAAPALESAWTAPSRDAEHVLDGRVRREHPRILLPELFAWDGISPARPIVRRRARYDRADRHMLDGLCDHSGVPARAACYLSTGRDADAGRLLAGLEALPLGTPRASGDVGLLWQLALGYDLIQASPLLGNAARAALQQRLFDQVIRMLDVLDGRGAALWHTRMSLAASAWLGAIVLDPAIAAHAAVQTRAQAHLLDNLAALALTEAWPEGYSYWINNRALLVALAAAAYLNGLEGTRHAPQIRELVRRTGHWTMHATRPDGRVEGLGDEGSRVDLKDETRRVIDVIAQLTRDPVLAGYSTYLRTLHGAASYYRGYRGQFALFNDPTVPAAGDGTLASIGAQSPRAALFGRDAMNLAYLRSDWGPQATFISFRAGHTLSHHGHYDAGHFTVFKGAPLAINSSSYTTMGAEHRLYYAIRSVAKNALLVLRPGEPVRPNQRFARQVADGGQRLTQPTGSTIDSTGKFLANLHAGQHLEGGIVSAFEQADDHVLISADLTHAYNSTAFDDSGGGGKIHALERSLLYLRDQDRVLVHDDVSATDPDFVKKWLLHSVARPQVDALTVLRGVRDDGILQSSSPRALVRNGNGVLLLERLFPRDAVLRMVGGPTHRYYVEHDGDEGELDGENFADGASERPWFDAGHWRLEIQPPAGRARDRFLVLLSPSLDTPRAATAQPLSDDRDVALGVRGDDFAVLFIDSRGATQVTLEATEWPRRVHVIGLAIEASASARLGEHELPLDGPGRAVRTIDVPAGAAPAPLTIRWQ